MTDEEKCLLEEERKNTFLLLIEIGKEHGNNLLNVYSHALHRKIEFETYDKEAEIKLLQKEFETSLTSLKAFIDREEDIEYELFLNFIKQFLKTDNITYLYKFIEAFIGEEPITKQPNYINGRQGFFRHKNHFYEDPIVTFSEYLIKVIGAAFFSRGKLPLIKGNIHTLKNSNERLSVSSNFVHNLKEEPIEEAFSSFEMNTSFSKVKFYNLIKEKGVICYSTTEDNFINIFSRSSKQNIKPIIWKETEVLLAYFLDNLKVVITPLTYSKRYVIASKCFKKENGQQINNEQLSRSSNNYQNSKSGKPKGAVIIDYILQEIQSNS